MKNELIKQDKPPPKEKPEQVALRRLSYLLGLLAAMTPGPAGYLLWFISFTIGTYLFIESFR